MFGLFKKKPETKYREVLKTVPGFQATLVISRKNGTTDQIPLSEFKSADEYYVREIAAKKIRKLQDNALIIIENPIDRSIKAFPLKDVDTITVLVENVNVQKYVMESYVE
jgi:hypothetical protein